MQQRLQRAVWKLRPGAWLAFVLPFAALVVAGFVGQRELFHTSYQAWGDSAVNGLSVLRAEHLEQLVGNYSRVGFHHPGPAFMYVLATGEVFFFHLLHVVPAPYNGQLLAVTVYVATMLGAACLVVFRSTRSTTATVATFVILFTFAARMPLLGQDWFPFLYVSAFLLLCIAGTAVAAGFTSEWPFFLAGAAFLAHGHASFLMFSAVTLLAVAAAWWWAHRGRVREELRAHRAAGLFTVGVAALASLPVVVNVVINFPGEWPKYFTFASEGEHAPRTASDVLDFVATSWTMSSMPFSWHVFVAAGVVGLVLLFVDHAPGRRRAVAGGYLLLALESAMYVFYVARGVDYLTPLSTYIYVGFFYRAVPITLLVLAAVQACLFLADFVRARTTVTAAVTVLGALACALVIQSGALHRPPAAGVTYDEAATTLIDLNRRDKGTIVLQNQTGEVWPTTAAVGLELTRLGQRWCTEGPNAVPIMFGDEHICTPTQSKRGMLVGVTNQPLPGRHRPVWTDGPTDPRIMPGNISLFLPRR